jgi:hypothetical protein
MISLPAWIQGYPGAITVCDPDGIILFMNDMAIDSHKADGGRELLGKNVLDCHPQPALGTLERMMETRSTNIYSVEKNGIKKLVHQSPWYEEGHYRGFLELVLEIPFEMPHLIRDK